MKGSCRCGPKGGFPSTFEIQTAASIAQQIEDTLQAGGERLSFISDMTPIHDGIDITIGSQHIGLLISQGIIAQLGGRYTTHPKLVGEKNGRQLFRITYSVRLPRFQKNDVIKVRNRYYEVLRVESHHIQTIDLRDGTTKSIREDDVEKIIGNSRNAEQALVVFADGKNMGIMDPQSSHTREYPQLKWLDVQTGDQIRSAAGRRPDGFCQVGYAGTGSPERKIRRTGRTAGWVDRTRDPYAEGDTLWVPVIASEPCDREIPERQRYRGRGYYMVGDIAVLHGKEPTRAEIDAIAGFRHPRGILWIKSLQDITRTPETKIVWGSGGEVCHKEAGFSYILDPEKVMFSMGNREEKARIARMVENSPRPERIADMFAGHRLFFHPACGCGCRQFMPWRSIPLHSDTWSGPLKQTTCPAGSPHLSETAASSLPAPMTASSWAISMQSPCSPMHCAMQNREVSSMSTVSGRWKNSTGTR